MTIGHDTPTHDQAGDGQDKASDFWTAYPEGCYVMMGNSNTEILALVMRGEITEEERLRRARLIAAAPDLLAACLRLISVNDECVAAVQRGEDLTPLGERFSDTLPAVRAAIAKATAQPTHLKEL